VLRYLAVPRSAALHCNLTHRMSTSGVNKTLGNGGCSFNYGYVTVI